MATDMRVGLKIEAQTRGDDKIAQLQRDVQGLGRSADTASPEFAALAQEVQELARQAQAIDGFTRLKQASEQTAAKLAEMQQATRQAALALKEKQQASAAAASAEQAAAAQLAQAREQQAQMQATVKALKTEIQTLAKAIKDGGDSSAIMTSQLADSQAQLRVLEAAAKAGAVQVKDLAQAHQGNAAALKAAEREVGAAQQQFERLRQSTRAVGQGLQEQQQDVQRARDGLTQVGLSAKDLAQGQIQVNKSTMAAEAALKALHAATKDAALAQTGAGNTAEQMGRKAQAGAQQAAQGAGLVQQSTHKVRDGVQSISTQLDTARQQLLGFLGIQMGAGAVKDVVALADAYKNLQSRIGLVVGEGPLLTQTMDDVQAVALRTRTALEATGTLFARLAQAGKDAGLSLEAATGQSLALTETISQAVAISGASAAASDAAITQLIQGLQSGVLRGDEFNSVMEQAPRLARALADGLGVTTGELRNLAQSGALTTDVVIKSLQSQGQTLEREFGKLPLTVGGAITNVQTAFMRYVADVDNANGVTEKIASTVGFVGENLETLADTLTIAGKSWLAFKAYNMAQTWLDKAKAIAAAKLAVQEEVAATAESTTVTSANTVAKVANAAAAKSQATASGGQAAAIAAETAAMTANTAATGAASTAKSAAANTAGLLSRGISATAGAARGLVGLLGGPVGAIVTLAMFSGEIKKGITSVVEWGLGFTEAGRRMKAVNAELAAQAAQEKVQQELRRQRAQEEAARTAKAQQAIAAQFDLSKAAQAATAEFVKLTKEGKTAAEAVAAIGKGFDTTTGQGVRDFGTTLNKLAADGKLSADQLKDAWGQILKAEDLQLFQLQARQAFSGTAQEAQIMAQITEAALSQALERTGLSFGLLTGGIGDASRSAINDVQTIVDSLDVLAQQGVDTSVALTASIGKAIDTADSQKAIEAVRGQIEQLRSQLGDKITDGLLQQAEQKARDLKKAMDDATPGIQSVEEAMRRLGITSDAALKEAAKSAREAFEELEADGTSSARVMQQAFAKVAQAAIDANGGIADSWTRSRAAMHGYTLEVDSAGREVLVLKSKLQDLGNANRHITGSMGADWQRLGNQVRQVQQQIERKPEIGTDGEEVLEQVSAAKGGGSFSALAYQQNAKDVHELDAWWQEYLADYNAKNAKYGGTSSSVNRYWIETQRAQYQQARKEIEQRERIAQSAQQKRQAAGAGGATYVSNITLPGGGGTRQVRFADAASQSAAEQLLRELAQAKGVAS